MDKISYLNGKFLAHSQAFVHIEDRGFQMADGVYEVILFYKNRLVDADEHLARLFRSLDEIGLTLNKTKDNLRDIALSLCKKNNLQDCAIYIQVTRGASTRSQTFPENYTPTLILTVYPLKNVEQNHLEKGYAAITHPDIRWGRCDIKSVGLLASTLARQKAAYSGADEAILIKDGFVTEASFSNVFIVDKKNNIVTRGADNNILCGITRNRVISLAKSNNIAIAERKFSEEELFTAKEVFITSSTYMVRAITQIDGKKIGSGQIGEVTKNMVTFYNRFIGK